MSMHVVWYAYKAFNKLYKANIFPHYSIPFTSFIRRIVEHNKLMTMWWLSEIKHPFPVLLFRDFAFQIAHYLLLLLLLIVCDYRFTHKMTLLHSFY